ncbi:unnamed protein product [Fusarium fujikuroi]|uniref:Uncharacterized protein n=1 Tax=Fusarium fujikuroi TaxID=5127 RepID=A0A9Q9RP73_FUSFU|nr:unnamed protein product [Fusarium fujikuroi]VTT71630.1 unnamed protein product [Fusarium fujikuroi]
MALSTLFVSVKLCWTVSGLNYSRTRIVFGDGLGPDTYPIEAKRGVGRGWNHEWRQIAFGHKIMIESGDMMWMFRVE